MVKETDFLPSPEGQLHEQGLLSKEAILGVLRRKMDEMLVVEGPRRRRFESVEHVFPRFISEQVEHDIALIEDAAPSVNPAKLELIAQSLAADRFEREATDPLTGLYSQRYAKEVLIERLTAELGNNERDSFHHIFRICLDINGLKAVNDYNEGRHEKGDEYLKFVADILKSSETIDSLRRQHCQVIVSRDHGDDFSITVIGDPTQEYQIEDIVRSIQIELEQTVIPERLMPKDHVIEKIGPLPDGFVFHPSAGGGATSVEDVLAHGQLHEKNIVVATDTPSRIAQKIMGELIDRSEQKMKLDKDAFKKHLRDGSEKDRYYLKAMSPRDQESLEQYDSMQQIIENQRRIIDELQRKGTVS